MRCLNNFKNDRICDICNLANYKEYSKCKKFYEEKIELDKSLIEIKNKCHYKTTCFDERTEFDGCSKNKNGHGRFADECNVSLKCLAYQKIIKKVGED